MRQAVIVSYARTGLAKAGRGGFNNTSNMTILGHAIEHAVKRSGVDPAEVEDVIAARPEQWLMFYPVWEEELAVKGE